MLGKTVLHTRQHSVYTCVWQVLILGPAQHKAEIVLTSHLLHYELGGIQPNLSIQNSHEQ